MSDPRLKEHGSLTARAAIASVSMALFLLALKAYAAWTTGSVAMLGSLADTAFDVCASLITLYGVRLAAQPADYDHRFGHGKAEALAALVQVALIAVSATGILWRAVERLRSGGETQGAEFGIGVSVVAILSTFLLLAYQRRVIARTGSVAIHADNVHYQSDLLLNGSVIVALALEQFVGLRGADPVFGIGIAAWLGWGAWKASSEAIDQLMDREWPEERRRRFVELANAQAGFRGIHDLRTRTSGAHDFAQFHAWVDPNMTIAEAHDVVEAAEQALHAAFPGAEVLIHLDPEGQIDRAGHHDEDLRETPET
ncbi:putative cation efflux protein [Sphingomonas changbaiensis NBRC 104936]|jgi:ferrous-iron efflux pump FieF|uniref:Putative cation efflux protein n=1 Tax=Sphingomonas changbaiensis NBRC 104936 TaxID=1219043 RepID=A0A0E9MRW6_9SPHN|nr:cation diffusion facilitator family transporter [Sphingomonas changbaiensis]GAO40507.1 putative cation efflux protein [Sphingomonas changbaiensis NBRC 104936]